MPPSMEAAHISDAALKVARANHYLVTLKPDLLHAHLDEAVQLLIDRMKSDGTVADYTVEETDLAFEVLFAAGGDRR